MLRCFGSRCASALCAREKSSRRREQVEQAQDARREEGRADRTDRLQPARPSRSLLPPDHHLVDQPHPASHPHVPTEAPPLLSLRHPCSYGRQPPPLGPPVASRSHLASSSTGRPLSSPAAQPISQLAQTAMPSVPRPFRAFPRLLALAGADLIRFPPRLSSVSLLPPEVQLALIHACLEPVRGLFSVDEHVCMRRNRDVLKVLVCAGCGT